MIFRDMTFCRAKDCAKFDQCERAYTVEVAALAKAFGRPVSLTARFQCYEPKDKENGPSAKTGTDSD